MPNITETISLLDELRGLLELYDKKREKRLYITGEEEDAIKVMERSIDIIEHLRQAALDGERYRKAGEALVEVVIGTTGVSVTEDFSRRAEKLYTAIEAYRQAVEQKEV